jgi:hypothetical protein
LPRRRIRTRPRELGAALAAALFVGGCGSGNERAAPPRPRLPAALAAHLASRSDDVARLLETNDGCRALAAAKELQRETVAAINARRVPSPLQEPLLTAANDLTVRIQCAPPPPPAAEGDKGKNDAHGKEHGKGHGKHERGRHGGEE